MTEHEKLLQNLIEDCSEDTAKAFFRRKNPAFSRGSKELENTDPDKFSKVWKIGELDFKEQGDRVLFAFADVKAELTERSCRKAQFDVARKILRSENVDAGIFIFKGANGAFRLSLVYKAYKGDRAELSPYRRFTYFVRPDAEGNTTFKRQLDRCAFDSLEAIKQAFSIEAVSEEFYRELSNWYFWALKHIRFPSQNDLPEDERNPVCTIRMITRLMFVWFMKQMSLVPDEFFEREKLETMLKSLNPEESTYYKAILQNLFFATLNTEMNHPKYTRRFRASRDKGRDGNYGIHSVYRYRNLFTDPDATLEKLFKTVPFLNGGLFECLDNTEGKPVVRIDGFSDREDNELHVPNFLFFGAEHAEDLSEAYGDKKRKKEKVSGLLDILSRYNFTVIENTPHESEVALDPELLGMVFENLLAAYNPETGATARKQTGSFYTPREIVSYMVDESLVAYLKDKLEPQSGSGIPAAGPNVDATPPSRSEGRDGSPSRPESGALGEHALPNETETKLRDLLSYDAEGNPFNADETEKLIAAVDDCKILDPACGSGAFPMGVLHKLVLILSKLDPGNEKWLQTQLEKLDDDTMRQDLERNFRENAEDYGRKLCLIENCIYGVDIQPIACQISKLRFFISLLCDQIVNPKKPNLGIRPLPNLETKFVAANTLIGIDMPADWTNDATISRLEGELKTIRHRHFSARTSETKRKYRDLDQTKRKELKEHLVAIATHPDETKITRFQQQIEKLRTDREKFSGEKWVEEKRAAQQDFLTEQQPEQQALFRVDLNARKREEIDRQIKELERAIAAERAKAENTGFEAEAQKLAGWNPYDQNASAPFFDPEWMFAVTDGFDVVIGNPPYLNVELVDSVQKKYYAEKYQTFFKRYDVFGLFYEIGITHLARSKGSVCFIVPQQIANNLSYRKLRDLILNNQWLREVLYLGDKIFDAANNDVCVLFLMKTQNPTIRLVHALDFEHRTMTEVSADHFKRYANVISFSGDAGGEAVFEKVFSSEHWRIKDQFSVFQGIVTGNNTAFLPSDDQIRAAKIENEVLRPVLLGRDFGKWVIRSTARRIIYVTGKTEIKTYPNTEKWLQLFRSKLEKRRECVRGVIPWYSLQWPRAEVDLNRIPKILVQGTRNPRLVTRIVATMDEDCVYGTQGLNFVVPCKKGASIYFVLAVLNSALVNYLYATKFLNVAIKAEYLKDTPIPAATPAQQKEIEGLVEQILALKKKDPEADVSALETEIDQLVYKLYDLTPEEVAIIEGQA